MNTLIYGAGALGQAIGCLLAAAGHRVSLVLRQRFIEVIERNGLRVTGLYGDYHVPGEALDLRTKIRGADGSAFDFILITTKSYDTAAAADDCATLAGCSCPVVSLQNGCGNIEELVRRFGSNRSLGGRVITGFEIVRPATVAITVSADKIHVGGSRPGTVPETAASLARAIDAAGLPCTAVADIHQSLFAKLLYNCALNPLGAILGVTYGVLAEFEDTRAIMDRVIEETFAVIGAIGGALPWNSPEEYRRVFYDTLIPPTSGHRPSMLQDLEQNKRTEVDALVGYVASQGRARGVATPCCDLLVSLIRFRERYRAPA